MTVITVQTATRPILLPAARIEYGARVVQTGTVYMHDHNLATVEAFIIEMSSVTPITLVTRTWDGDTHGPWLDQLLEGTTK